VKVLVETVTVSPDHHIGALLRNVGPNAAHLMDNAGKTRSCEHSNPRYSPLMGAPKLV